MQTPKLLLLSFFLLCLLTGHQGVEASGRQLRRQHHQKREPYHSRKQRSVYGYKPNKLFVFGDSYADTGNAPISGAGSWKSPYGITFPGKPAGRFSDGRVLTDYLAKFVGVRSPIPYRWREVGAKHVKYGMNFAVGGSGVFEALSEPNMTTQIDFFQQLIKESVYTPPDLQYSAAVVTLSGNDYAAYIANNGSPQGWQAFITGVVNQLTVNLKRIHGLGVRKVAVTALQPLGCLPRSTAISAYQQCNATENSLVNFHNLLLQQAIAKLNNETRDSTFVILDLFTSFMSVLNQKGDHSGSVKFDNPLKPCCVGISSQYSCGSVDGKGAKMYTVCDDPKSAFFWDNAHPTQEGWIAVYSALQKTLHQVLG